MEYDDEDQDASEVELTAEEEALKLLGAAKTGDLATVKDLLDDAADATFRDEQNWNALLWASNNGHTEVVETLLEAGASGEFKQREMELVGSEEGKASGNDGYLSENARQTSVNSPLHWASFKVRSVSRGGRRGERGGVDGGGRGRRAGV